MSRRFLGNSYREKITLSDIEAQVVPAGKPNYSALIALSLNNSADAIAEFTQTTNYTINPIFLGSIALGNTSSNGNGSATCSGRFVYGN